MADVRDPWRWRPLTGMPPDAHEWLAPDYEAFVAEWVDLKDRLATDARAAAFVEDRLTKRQREFAVETGAIERLYHLRRGVTQRLVAEGLHTAVAAHTVEGVRTETLRGLLVDQEAALEVVYRDTAADAEISPAMLKRWHALLVRNQETVTGMTRDGVLGQVPFTEKGVWKTQPNNPSIPGKGVFEYCPPARVAEEVDRLCAIYSRVRRERFPVHAEAAWLHHRFARTHPFQDGNGRVSRLLWRRAIRGGASLRRCFGPTAARTTSTPCNGPMPAISGAFRATSPCRRRPPSSQRTRRHRTPLPAGWRIRHPTARGRLARRITNRRSVPVG